MLCVRGSAVTIYEDETQLVSELREYHQLRKTYGNAKGSVDLAGWLRAEAEAIVDKTDPHYRQAALEHCDGLRAMFASAAESVDDWTRAYLQTNHQSSDLRQGVAHGSANALYVGLGPRLGRSAVQSLQEKSIELLPSNALAVLLDQVAHVPSGCTKSARATRSSTNRRTTGSLIPFRSRSKLLRNESLTPDPQAP